MSAEPYLGEIHIFGFNFPPLYWASCNGQLLQINQNTALFSLLGTMYGGDGRTTFALPNLQGSVPIGFGLGPGLSPRVLGEKIGSESETLSVNEFPAHNHEIGVKQSVATVADTTNPTNASLVKVNGDKHFSTALLKSVDVSNSELKIESSNSGGNQPHNNMQPYLALNFCIAFYGIYPQRS